MASLSEKLFSLRKKKGLTQEDVAEGAGIVLRSYRRYETGEREPVTIDFLVGRTDEEK